MEENGKTKPEETEQATPEDTEKKPPKPPKMSPYVFTVLLMGFGLWCMWDGWFTSDPEMAEHALFNQVLAAVLIPWAVWDFFNVRKKYGKKK